MRWWSVITAEGDEEWRFESTIKFPHEAPVDSPVFWYGQLAGCLAWTVLALVKVLTFDIFYVRSLGFAVRFRDLSDGHELVRLLFV